MKVKSYLRFLLTLCASMLFHTERAARSDFGCNGEYPWQRFHRLSYVPSAIGSRRTSTLAVIADSALRPRCWSGNRSCPAAPLDRRLGPHTADRLQRCYWLRDGSRAANPVCLTSRHRATTSGRCLAVIAGNTIFSTTGLSTAERYGKSSGMALFSFALLSFLGYLWIPAHLQ